MNFANINVQKQLLLGIFTVDAAKVDGRTK